MPGKTDIEISNALLDRLAPATKRVREEADRKRYQNNPTWPARSLTALASEERELSARQEDRLKSVDNEGGDPDGDRELRAFRAARLRLRETIAEVSVIALEVCPASVRDRAAAEGLLQLQRAEFWSLRTGYGAYRKTLERLPQPRGRKLDRDTIDKEADALAAMALAETEEDMADCLERATKAGLDASALEAQLEGRAVVEEALQEEADRRKIRLQKAAEDRVAALKAEKGRDPAFYSFLLQRGWLSPDRFWIREIRERR